MPRIYITFLLALMISSPTMASDNNNNNNPSRSHDLEIAIEEMARANYFTFVTLINISPLDPKLQQNITFLMPNDRILSKARISQDSNISGFLLRHSIPSPLLFDHLQHIPSGSIIPTSDPQFKVDINNNGRRNFFLNNVKIISPNLCTLAHSIRCHGVDAVLATRKEEGSASCSNTTTPPVVVAAPPVAFPVGGPIQIPVAAPQPVQLGDVPKPSSGSQCMCHDISFKLLATFVAIIIMVFNI